MGKVFKLVNDNYKLYLFHSDLLLQFEHIVTELNKCWSEIGLLAHTRELTQQPRDVSHLIVDLTASIRYRSKTLQAHNQTCNHNQCLSVFNGTE